MTSGERHLTNLSDLGMAHQLKDVFVTTDTLRLLILILNIFKIFIIPLKERQSRRVDNMIV
jgi:hypothetical protein